MAALLDDPLALLIAQATLIIVLARLLGLLARRYRQPMVVAEIAAGILLGPSLVGWLAPGAHAALFPERSLGLLDSMSQVGLILFMFLIGLELDPKLLTGRARSSLAISNASIVVPFLLGGLLAWYLHPLLAAPSVTFVSFGLFIATAMSITAFPVLARILVERRLLRSPVGSLSIASAAIGDVTAWCILAFVVSFARSERVLGAVLTTALAAVYIALMLGVVRPFLQRLADRNRLGLTQNLLAAVLVLLLISSFATELIGIHALFGAFLFGSILPKAGSFARALAEKIEDLVVVLLLPLFFAYSGLRTEIGLLEGPADWLVCGLIVLVACAGKFGGSALAARLSGLSWRESGAIGVLMNTRGLMELIVLNIGLDLGVISPKLFTMLVIMALLTTVITTPLLQLFYPLEELARRIASESDPVSPEPEPDGYTAMVCVSLERSGPALITLGAAIAGKSHDRSRLYALRLEPPTDRASFVLQQREGPTVESEQAVLGPLLERAESLGVKVRTLSFVSNELARDICDVARVKRADLVLLGWHKPLLGAAMLGGTVHDVMTEASSDVGVLVDRGLSRIAKVLVPYLGSDHDRAALALAKRIGENTGASVTVLHVVVPAEHEALGAHKLMQEEFRETGTTGRSFDVSFKVVPHSTPAEAAIEESARGYDLVLIGAGREWGLEQRSFGLSREAILVRSAASVLVLRRAARASPEPAAEPRAEMATVP